MAMTGSETTEASVVANLAELAVARVETVTPHREAVASFIVKNDENRETDSFERYLAEPRRSRGWTQVTDVASFVTLVESTSVIDDVDEMAIVLFADQPAGRITAVFNYRGWRDHETAIVLVISDEWKLWRGIDGKLLPQLAFSEHLEDGLSSIVSPPAADLLEIAQTFQAKKSLDFESSQRLASGDVKFTYHEQTKAGAGVKGSLSIPERFELRMPIYRGSTPYVISARLRYRITPDGLSLGYKLDRPAELVEAAFRYVSDEIVSELGSQFLIVDGPAPESIRAI